MPKLLPAALPALALLAACQSPANTTTADAPASGTKTMLYDEAHRPQVHFSPPKNWMNDPNGLVYENGTYHLFFQQNPTANVAGNLHWGHATSRDLVHWQPQATALAPDSLGLVFSGSAVLDAANTSGLGKAGQPPLVALYTAHDTIKEKAGRTDVESQCLAYSLDHGQTWTKYAHNPVLKNQGSRDFRDPKVSWHPAEKQWVMPLSAHDHVEFYGSKNLTSWAKLGEFGRGLGAHGGVWECPDLVQVPDGAGRPRWVLIVNMNPGGPNGGSATQYFVGNFDGKTFSASQPGTRWMDYGPDNYAGITWGQLPAGAPPTLIGWMSNWNYGQQVPTSPWRSAMTVPRTLRLLPGLQPSELLLASQPLPAVADKLAEDRTSLPNVQVQGSYDLAKSLKHPLGRYALSFTVPQAQSWAVELSNSKQEKTLIGYDHAQKRYYFDRSHSGNVTFAPADKGFAAVAYAPRLTSEATQDVRLVIDVASVELFADGGRSGLTGIFFPSQPYTGLALQAPQPLKLPTVEVMSLRSIWEK